MVVVVGVVVVVVGSRSKHTPMEQVWPSGHMPLIHTETFATLFTVV